jgi:hypothetical protein
MKQQQARLGGEPAGQNDLLLIAAAERCDFLLDGTGFQVHAREIGIGQNFHPLPAQNAPVTNLAKACGSHVVKNTQYLKRACASTVRRNQRHSGPDDIPGRSDFDSAAIDLDGADESPSPA